MSFDDTTDLARDALAQFIEGATHVHHLVTEREWDSSKDVDHGRLFVLVRSYLLITDAHARLNGGDSLVFARQKRDIGAILLDMLRYKPGHQEIFEPYAVRLSSALRVAYEDRLRMQLDDLGVFGECDEEKREYLLRFAAEKRWKPDELVAQLTNAKHNLAMENGEVQETAWEAGILAASRAIVAMDAVQDEVYGLLSDIALDRAVASTPEGIAVIDKAADAVLQEAERDVVAEEGDEGVKGDVEIPGVAVYRASEGQ